MGKLHTKHEGKVLSQEIRFYEVLSLWSLKKGLIEVLLDLKKGLLDKIRSMESCIPKVKAPKSRD